jgi:hypothetical protein
MSAFMIVLPGYSPAMDAALLRIEREFSGDPQQRMLSVRLARLRELQFRNCDEPPLFLGD